MNYEKYLAKINEIMKKDYDHEIPDIPRAKEYNKVLTSLLRAKFPKTEGYTVTLSTKGVSPSYFIAKNDQYVYIHFNDYRYDPWYLRILYRSAKNEKDYTGGANHFTSLYMLKPDTAALFDRI